MVVVWTILALILVLVVIVLARTLMLKPTAAQNAVIELDKTQRAVLYGDKLSKMIQVETISEPNQHPSMSCIQFLESLCRKTKDGQPHS